MSMLNRAFLQSLFARSMKSMKKTKMRIFLIMNFLKPPVSVCCQILRKASDHTIVLTEKLLNYFLKSKFGSFCALSYVEKCGQSEKVVHTKERGKGWGPISTSTIVLYKYKEKHKDKCRHKDKCKHKDKIQGDGIQFQQQQVFLQIQTQRHKQLQKINNYKYNHNNSEHN